MPAVLGGSRSVGNRQRAVGKKYMGLPIGYCQLPTLRTGLEKIATRQITLNLTLATGFFQTLAFGLLRWCLFLHF